MRWTDPLVEQPFEAASNRGFRLLLAAGVALLALVAVVGRQPLLAAAVVAYLLALPAYVVYRVRTWNESLAEMDVPTGREEASVAGLGGDDGDRGKNDGDGGDGDDGGGEADGNGPGSA